jgi:hypothetical protein
MHNCLISAKYQYEISDIKSDQMSGGHGKFTGTEYATGYLHNWTKVDLEEQHLSVSMAIVCSKKCRAHCPKVAETDSPVDIIWLDLWKEG